jgi:hypothetical protein
LLFLALVAGIGASVLYRLSHETSSTSAREIVWSTAAHAGLLFPLAFTARLAAEAVSGVGGLGALVRRALAEGNLSPLMIASLCLALAGLASALVTDIASARGLSRGEPRSMPRTRHAFTASVAATVFAIGLSLLRPLLDGWFERVAAALSHTLPFIAVALVSASATAIVLGFVAGAMSRTVSALLSRALELSCSLPTPLLAAFAFGLGYHGALLLGVVRGVEAAYLLRERLIELRTSRDLAPHALGRAPLIVYIRLLPAALGPTLGLVALTGSWIVGLEAAASALGAFASGSVGALALRDGSAGFLAVAIVVAACALWGKAAHQFGTAHVDDPSRTGPLVIQLRRRIRSGTPDRDQPGA